MIASVYATPKEPRDVPRADTSAPWRRRGTVAPNWKSGATPWIKRATAIAPADAPSAATAVRVSKRRTSSSRTNTAPAIGALKAVASPAPAPAANSTRAVAFVPKKQASDDVCNRMTHLYAGALAPKRETRSDRQQAADELDDGVADGPSRLAAAYRSFDLRYAAARRVRRDPANERRGDSGGNCRDGDHGHQPGPSCAMRHSDETAAQAISGLQQQTKRCANDPRNDSDE